MPTINIVKVLEELGAFKDTPSSIGLEQSLDVIMRRAVFHHIKHAYNISFRAWFKSTPGAWY